MDLRDGSIAWTVDRLKEINATWTLIYAQDELQAQRAAKACWAAGIMPVVRIGKKVDEFNVYWLTRDTLPRERALVICQWCGGSRATQTRHAISLPKEIDNGVIIY